MNPQTYAQMLELQQQKGAPLVSQGAPQPQNFPMVPKYDAQNPLSEGSMKAVNAARQSMGGRKKGMLSGLLDVANQFSINSLRGSNTVAGRALGHSFKTPDEVEAENYKMMQFLAEQEAANQALALKQQKMMQDNAHRQQEHNYRQQSLSERMRHHKALESHYGSNSMGSNKYSKEDKALMDTEMLQQHIPDAVPFSAMTQAERSAASKNLKSRMNAPKSSGHVLKIFDEVVNITKNNPDLSTSWTTLLGGSNVPSRWFSSKKDRKDLEKLRTLKNQLALATVEKGVGTARMGVFLEKLIANTKPDETQTPETIEYFRDQAKKIHDETIKDSKIAKKGFSGIKGIGRYDVPEYYEEYKEPESAPDISKISNEEIYKELSE